MKRFAAVALLIAGFALPVCAQRGMSRGGFSGHSAEGFRGGFAAPHFGFSGPRFSSGFTGPHGYGFTGGPRYPSGYFSARPYGAYSGFRPPYSAAGSRYRRYRRSYFSAYGAPGFYAVPEWIGLGPLGYYSDDFGYDDWADSSGAAAGNYVSPEYEAQPEEQEQPVYREDYEPSAEIPPQPQAPVSENATTIIFKDGRPSEQIHNYALTRTTLYVLDQQRRDIPLNQIDLAATEKANRNAGIEFQVPVTAE